ncbi:DUF2934 domain-containing protein [Thermodesulfovibrio hydrogeniphilus]
MVDRERLEEEIRQVAYELYVKSGCIAGRDIDNWLEAERIVLRKYNLIKEEQPEEVKEEPEKPKTKRTRACKRTSSAKSKSTSKARGRRKKE